jgi:nitrite reductase (NADH) small subunit
MTNVSAVIPAKAGIQTGSLDIDSRSDSGRVVVGLDSRLRGNDKAVAWKFVCKLDDLPVLGARVFERSEADGGNVAVFRNDQDVVFALLDKCPHKGGPLSQGIVFGERVACPLHNWSIELNSGDAVAPDVGCTQRFPVKVENSRVFVELS